MLWQLQVEHESQVYESTLQKMNQQLETSLAIMAGEKAALQLSLTGLQQQFEDVAQAVYSADESVVGACNTAQAINAADHLVNARHSSSGHYCCQCTSQLQFKEEGHFALSSCAT